MRSKNRTSENLSHLFFVASIFLHAVRREAYTRMIKLEMKLSIDSKALARLTMFLVAIGGIAGDISQLF